MTCLTSSRLGLSILFTSVLFTFAAFLLPHPKYKSPVFGQQETNSERRIIAASDFDMDRLPIKVKAYKYLESANWTKDLEIHFENISSKSIYFVRLNFGFPDVRTSGGTYGFSVYHGDRRLRFEGELSTPKDKPVLPGQKFVIKLPEFETKWFLHYLSEVGLSQSAIVKILMNINEINFGDGTGVQLIDRKYKMPNSSSNNERRENVSARMVPTDICQHEYPGFCVMYVYWPNWECVIASTGVLCSGPYYQDAATHNSQAQCYWPLTNDQARTKRCGPLQDDWCWDHQTPTRCFPRCPDHNETNPHLECGTDGYCKKVYTCGRDSPNCSREYEPCGCIRSGDTNPHWDCIDGDCVKNSFCGKTTCNCDTDRCDNAASCPQPCNFPRTNPHWICNGDNGCLQVNECGSSSPGSLCQGGRPDGSPCYPCPDLTVNCTPRIESGCSGGQRPDRCSYPETGCPTGMLPFDGCCCTTTPVIIDLNDDGYNLTNLANGVNFDFNNDGVKERISWTSLFSDEAFLVLDRNGNGQIDGGRELFGNSSPQPLVENANGFLSLAEFDKPWNGGFKDGVIDDRDAVFPQLQLWQDRNHNGTSDDGELSPLSAFNIFKFDLSYEEVKLFDIHGNWFRYRAKIYRRQVVNGQTESLPERWAWDVFLLRQV